MLKVLFSLFCVLICQSPLVWATAGSGQQPVLRINTEAHTAAIRQIAVDRKANIVATVSDDKTLRIWTLPDLRLKRVIRPPIGPRIEGQLLTVSISPVSGFIAVGGNTGNRTKSIYVFDPDSGELKNTLRGLPNTITALSFSDDGRYLAALVGGQHGLRVWATDSWELIDGDLEYGGAAYGIDFSIDGKLITTSDDGLIRLYDKNLGLSTAIKAPSGLTPFGVEFSPDGTKVALGYVDSSWVTVLSAEDLSVVATYRNGEVKGDFSSVTWAKNGDYLYGAGTFIGKDDDERLYRVRRWGRNGDAEDLSLKGTMSTVMSVVAVSDQGVALVTADATLGMLSADSWYGRKPETLDYKGEDRRLWLSPNGNQLFVEFGNSDKGAVFSIQDRSFYVVDRPPRGFSPPKTDIRRLDLQDPLYPTFKSLNITLQPYEVARSVASDRRDGGFLLGTEWFLRSYSASGTERWNRETNGIAWQVNVSENGKVGVAGQSDGTIRWFDMETGTTIGTLFVHADKTRWIFWTPEGFFDHSDGGEELVGYHVNQAAGQAAAFIPVARLYDNYYRPDLVRLKFLGMEEQQLAVAKKKLGTPEQTLSDGLAPEVNATAVADSDGNIVVNVELLERGGGVGRIVYKLNGVTVQVRDHVGQISGESKTTSEIIKVPEQGGLFNISVSAFNADNRIESEISSVQLTVKSKIAEVDVKPRLFVLGVGVDEYRGDLFPALNYSVSDAEKLLTTIDAHGGDIYSSRTLIPLSNQQASAEKIEKQFLTLSKQIKPSDVFVLYMAGHGAAVDGKFHFFPWQEQYTGEIEGTLTAAIDQQKLQYLMSQIPALKSAVVLDACYSGSFLSIDDQNLKTDGANARISRALGRAVLSATSENQEAIEGFRGMGVFTYALTKGLAGRAEANNDGVISISELAAYSRKEVSDISMAVWKKPQTPSYLIKGIDFSLAASKD